MCIKHLLIKAVNIFRIFTSKSIIYILFRSKYELERRCGLLALRFPIKPASVILPILEEWRATDRYLFDNVNNISVQRKPNDELKRCCERIISGDIQFFSHKWIHLCNDYDWVTNPLTGYHYDVEQHWTKVQDFNKDAGDIKFVWEKSRFSYLYTIVRNDYHNNENHGDFVISQILDWIDKNPLNCGPNYKCSQEISLRVLNWLFALNFYKFHPCLTEDSWSIIIKSIYWQIDHVYKNINFSRIAVRNNHAITETLTLYLIGLMFPEFHNSSKWKANGKQWFEKEIEYQFQPDGSYLQNSMNYQRVVTQLLTLGIALAEKNGERFNSCVYERAYANVNFLYQCQDDLTGMLPNYGANDGALFFQLSSNDYSDFRPQIDALYHVLTNKHLYKECFEDSDWFGGYNLIKNKKIQKQQGVVSFPDSGYFIFREGDVFSFIRCGQYKGISTCDQQHLDIWINGENLLMDSGSYTYNTDKRTVKYYSGTESHNTVMLDDYDQMLKGPRFMWFYPSSIKNVDVIETENEYIYTGCVECFKYLGKNILHKRSIRKVKNKKVWRVEDEIINKPSDVSIRQLWHTMSEDITIYSDAVARNEHGMYSRYYGVQLPNKQIEIRTDKNLIRTTISIQ